MLLLVLFQKFWMFLGKVLHKRRYNFPSVYSVAAIPENSMYIRVKQEKLGIYLLKEVTLITFSFTKCYLCNTQKTLSQISSSPSGDYPAFGCCCSGRVLEGHLLPLLPPAFSVPAYPSLLTLAHSPQRLRKNTYVASATLGVRGGESAGTSLFLCFLSDR